MEIDLFDSNELIEKSGLDTETLSEWMEEGILAPEGYAEDSTPIFSDTSLETVKKIRTMMELGYDQGDIKKIIKKIGIPTKKSRKTSHSMHSENYLTVGSLAERIDVSPRTIKHWEEKGIIEPDLRSRGGFRLYKEHYTFFCNLIKDLQLFGYSLDEIKTISDYFRDFIALKDSPSDIEPAAAAEKIEMMETEISRLFEKTEQLKNGIKRWEDLLRKQKKQISLIREKNKKRLKGDLLQ
jgi:DNA-binding transcriptional MerR regulator